MARPDSAKRAARIAPARRSATLRPAGQGDASQRSPARELQGALSLSLVPSAADARLPVGARIAVIAGLAMLSWSVVGGAAYLAIR